MPRRTRRSPVAGALRRHRARRAIRVHAVDVLAAPFPDEHGAPTERCNEGPVALVQREGSRIRSEKHGRRLDQGVQEHLVSIRRTRP
jgi:hypothetical protein